MNIYYAVSCIKIDVKKLNKKVLQVFLDLQPLFNYKASKINYNLNLNLRPSLCSCDCVIIIQALGKQLAFMTRCNVPWLCDMSSQFLTGFCWFLIKSGKNTIS